MTAQQQIQPKITVLEPGQIETIHSYSLEILAKVGVRADAEGARRLFRQALGPQAVDGDRIRIPPDLVEWALTVAAPAVTLHDRLGNVAFALPGETRFGIGVTTLFYQDPIHDEVSPFGRSHMRDMVRLGSRLSSFDAISTVGILQDVSPSLSDLYGALEMAANTTKPLVLLVSDETAFPAVLDLLEHLCGDLAARPSVLPYLNPITPLVINQGTFDKMVEAIRRGLPFIYSNYGMAGATTPITPAGALAVLNAELLAGLVLAQLVQEGAAMVLGSLPAYFDMRGVGSFYDPHSYLIDLVCAEMMAHYGLPHCGTSGSGVGWGADLLTAGHQWMNHLVSCMGKVGLAPFVGDILGSMAFSPATIVYADQVIQQARRLSRGFDLSDAEVDINEIGQTGPGGNFLTSEQTLRRFRQASYHSPFLPPMTLDQWEAKGRPKAADQLKEATRKQMASLEPPSDHSDLLSKGEAFIRNRATHS